MKWHDELLDFGIEDSAATDPNDPEAQLLMIIVERTCIARFQSLVTTFDIFSSTQNDMALKCIRVLLDYTSIRSMAMTVLHRLLFRI